MSRYLVLLLRLFIFTILLGVVMRLLFLTFQFNTFGALSPALFFGAFWHGLALDIALAGYICVFPWLIGLCGILFGRGAFGEGGLLRVYYLIIAFVVAFVVAVDVNLYEHWGYRIDATLLPYIASPVDAAASLSIADMTVGVGLFMLLFWVIVVMLLRFVNTRGWSGASDYLIRGGWFLVWSFIGGVLFLSMRGGVSESVANVSQVYFSNNTFANHAAVNPVFSLFSSLGKAERFGEMYRFWGSDAEAKKILDSATSSAPANRRSTRGTKVTKVDKESVVSATPNVAIIIAESFTKGIMELKEDDKYVMPNLRRIASEGLEFTNTYASGSRTDRGVAAVLSGFPAQPKSSVMKLPAKSRNLPSLAKSLGAKGYGSHFYYGGDLNFMNMSSYLYGTGWQNLVWGAELRDRIEKSVEKGQWGYRDETMADVFATDIIALSRSKEPFLATWLTLSSHKPFDVGRNSGFEDAMLNSMAYSDYEVGRCVEMLRRSEAWDNLLLIIVADHSYAYPVDAPYNSPQRFQIPMIWSGGALRKKGVVESYTSQTNLAATLLGAMNIGAGDFSFSYDVLSASYKPFAYYVFNSGFGVVTEQDNVIYDGAVTSSSSPLESAGKAMLQLTHSALEEL